MYSCANLLRKGRASSAVVRHGSGLPLAAASVAVELQGGRRRSATSDTPGRWIFRRELVVKRATCVGNVVGAHAVVGKAPRTAPLVDLMSVVHHEGDAIGRMILIDLADVVAVPFAGARASDGDHTT